MFKYIWGLLINLLNPAVSLFSKIDNSSVVNHMAKIYGNTQVFQSKVGAHSYVSRGTCLVHTTVGKFCSIAQDCRIGLGTHTLANLSTSPIFTQHNNALKQVWTNAQEENLFPPVTIGNDVWIGHGAIVMSGITIGDGAVIGAGAVVTKNVPPYAIMGGMPAKVIRYRFDENMIDTLLKLKWWDKDEDWLKKHISIFQKHLSIDDLKMLQE